MLGRGQTVTRSHFGGEFPLPIDTVGIMGYNYLGTAPGWCFTICRERPRLKRSIRSMALEALRSMVRQKRPCR